MTDTCKTCRWWKQDGTSIYGECKWPAPPIVQRISPMLIGAAQLPTGENHSCGAHQPKEQSDG